MLAGRCPRCREGRVFPPFWSARLLAMNPVCEVCGLKFEREPGYFLGAMYFSYTLGVLTILPVSLLLILVAGWDLAPVMVVMFAQTLISMPLFFRYSRVMWLHLDLAFIPVEEKG
jgi:uncharacterized protein (DUF983 family)